MSRPIDQSTTTGPLSAEASGDPLPRPGRTPKPASAAKRALAKPPVRRLARDLGLDLDAVQGTGPEGTITADDVLTAAVLSRGMPEAAAGITSRVPLKGVRREMARTMAESFKVPTATVIMQTDVTASMELVERLRARREFAGLRVSPLLIFAKAACLAIARNPDLNSTLDMAASEIVRNEDVNLGIAAATPRGLMVPNIKGCENLNFGQFWSSYEALVRKARAGKLEWLDDPAAEIAAVMDALRRPSRDLAQEYAQALAEQLPLIKRDGGFVREGYEAALDETRSLRDASRLVVAAMQARYADDTGIKGLKIRHNNVLGYFVEVTAQHGDKLMSPPLNATFIHRQTLAGQVRFTTSELGEIEAKIANAGDRALGLELEIFDRLSTMALAAGDELRAAAHAFAQLDVATALARLAGASAPEALADQLMLLIAGAITARHAGKKHDAALTARAAAEMLVGMYCGQREPARV